MLTAPLPPLGEDGNPIQDDAARRIHLVQMFQHLRLHLAPSVCRLPALAQAPPGIDLQGDGGYVVAPPSIHANGRRYRWDRRRIADLPSWIQPQWIAPARTATFAITGGASAYDA